MPVVVTASSAMSALARVEPRDNGRGTLWFQEGRMASSHLLLAIRLSSRQILRFGPVFALVCLDLARSQAISPQPIGAGFSRRLFLCEIARGRLPTRALSRSRGQVLNNHND